MLRLLICPTPCFLISNLTFKVTHGWICNSVIMVRGREKCWGWGGGEEMEDSDTGLEVHAGYTHSFSYQLPY